MVKVYVKLNGKLALYDVDTVNHVDAINVVRKELRGQQHGIPLVLYEQPKQMDLFHDKTQ